MRIVSGEPVDDAAVFVIQLAVKGDMLALVRSESEVIGMRGSGCLGGRLFVFIAEKIIWVHQEPLEYRKYHWLLYLNTHAPN